jgi:hypothetical protein
MQMHIIHSPSNDPLEPMVHLATGLQLSEYRNFIVMCDVPSIVNSSSSSSSSSSDFCTSCNAIKLNVNIANRSGHAILRVGVRLFDCWDCRFESR